MDGGVIVAEGSPAELIARYSTREVLELRFAPGRARAPMAAQLADLADRVEVLPDRLLLYTGDGEPPRPRCTSAGCARSRAGARGPRWRTCSCGSPAGGWWTDGHRAGAGSRGPRSSSSTSGRRYRRNWRGDGVSSILQPVLFLGLRWASALGTLVDSATRRRRRGPQLPRVPRARACWRRPRCRPRSFESTYPVIAGFKWQRTYHAMMATPIGVRRRARRPPALHRRPGARSARRSSSR